MSKEERLCITENTLQDCMNKISDLEKKMIPNPLKLVDEFNKLKG